MHRVASFAKTSLIPGSTSFFVIAAAIGALLFPAGAPAVVPVACLAALVALYWILSLPAIATALIDAMSGGYPPLRDAAHAEGVSTLVILGNGSVTYRSDDLSASFLARRTVFCVFEGVRVSRLLAPARVIVSGGPSSDDPAARPESELMRDLLISFGVPAERIEVDASSRTTGAQAANVAARLARAPRAILITTPAHMRRSLMLFHRHGVRVIPAPVPDLRYDSGKRGWKRWYPSGAALRGSESALYECIALAVAGLRS